MEGCDVSFRIAFGIPGAVRVVHVPVIDGTTALWGSRREICVLESIERVVVEVREPRRRLVRVLKFLALRVSLLIVGVLDSAKFSATFDPRRGAWFRRSEGRRDRLPDRSTDRRGCENGRSFSSVS